MEVEWVVFPTPGDLPNLRIEPMSLVSPRLKADFLTLNQMWSSCIYICVCVYICFIYIAYRCYIYIYIYMYIYIYIYISHCNTVAYHIYFLKIYMDL